MKMAIGLNKAKEIVEEMVKKSNRNLVIVDFTPVESDEDDGFYMFGVRDEDTGKYYHPGELLPCINMTDGKPNDFSLVPPGI